MSGNVGLPGQGPPQVSVPAGAPEARWRRPFNFACGVLAVLGASLWVCNEAQPRERDYHAVSSEFERIERKMHDHAVGLWLTVEGEPHEQGAGAAAQEDRHRRILDDFAKLRQAGAFALTDIDIQVEGDRAHLRYTLRSSPELWRPMPSGGTMEFVRKDGRWVLDDHHFAGQR